MSLLYENGKQITNTVLESYFINMLERLNEMSYNSIPVISTGQILGVGYSLNVPVIEEVMSTKTEQYFDSVNAPQYTEYVFDNTRWRLTENYLQKWYDDIDDINRK